MGADKAPEAEVHKRSRVAQLFGPARRQLEVSFCGRILIMRARAKVDFGFPLFMRERGLSLFEISG